MDTGQNMEVQFCIFPLAHTKVIIDEIGLKKLYDRYDFFPRVKKINDHFNSAWISATYEQEIAQIELLSSMMGPGTCFIQYRDRDSFYWGYFLIKDKDKQHGLIEPVHMETFVFRPTQTHNIMVGKYIKETLGLYSNRNVVKKRGGNDILFRIPEE